MKSCNRMYGDTRIRSCASCLSCWEITFLSQYNNPYADTEYQCQISSSFS